MFFEILSNLFLLIGVVMLIVGVVKTITESTKKNKIKIYFRIIILAVIFINISYIIYSILEKNNLFICGSIVLICIIITEYIFNKHLLKVYKNQ